MHQYTYINICLALQFAVFFTSQKADKGQEIRLLVLSSNECQILRAVIHWVPSMCLCARYFTYMLLLHLQFNYARQISYISSESLSKFLQVTQLESSRARIHIQVVSLQSSFLYFVLSFRDHSHLLGQCSPSFGMHMHFPDIEVVQDSIF